MHATQTRTTGSLLLAAPYFIPWRASQGKAVPATVRHPLHAPVPFKVCNARFESVELTASQAPFPLSKPFARLDQL